MEQHLKKLRKSETKSVSVHGGLRRFYITRKLELKGSYVDKGSGSCSE